MQLHPASFKDPSGFLFTQDGVLYRQVRHCYAPHYDQLLSSGLYHALTVKKWLIKHEEVSTEIIDDPSAYKILKPDRLQVITYPYEWTFSQLKQAGLRTLEIMKTAMTYGMSLKDASAYNIQFRDGQPLLIDTLSFERYEPTQPWIAYRQYCQHFLYPLMLEQYVGVGCIGWMRNYLDGFPAETVARMLPFKSKWNMGALLHLHLQKRMNKKSSTQHTAGLFSPKKMNLLIDDLHRLTNSLHPGYPKQSTWSDYYGKTILGKQYLLEKERLVTHWLTTSGPVRVIDAGANDGFFSVLAARLGHEVIAIENDPVCIEQLHQRIQIEKIKGLHTVVSDLSNPSPALGFAHRERSCLTERCTGDILMALALIHHLVIGHSIPLKRLAAFFSLLAPILILEFVPKEDEKVKTMLQSRKDIFDEYDAAHMEMYFSNYYSIRKKENIIGTQRTLYWMERNTLPAT